MKLLVVSTLAIAVIGFSPSQMQSRRQATALHMAVTSFPGPENDWTNKPIPRKGERTTQPMADRKVSWLEKQAIGDVMIDPDYFLTVAVALLCPLIIWYHPSYAESGPSVIGVAGGLFHLLFAALLGIQTRRVRCVFEKDAFEFYNIKGPGLDLEKGAWLQEKPANYVAGTRNRWKYDTIINYGFFPSLEFPVICYFKETETPKEQWNKWFAAFDSYGGGQPHFFPGICNVHQFKAEMEKRGVKHKPIPTFNKNKPAKK
jgi:hypothetical protein